MKRNSTIGRLLAAGLLAVSLSSCAALGVGAAAGAAGGGVESAKAEKRQADYGPGTYTVTVLSNALYFPAKVIFAGAGAVTSGVAYVATLGNRETTDKIWDASTGGDYLVTPSMIAGDRQVQFVGRRTV